MTYEDNIPLESEPFRFTTIALGKGIKVQKFEFKKIPTQLSRRLINKP